MPCTRDVIQSPYFRRAEGVDVVECVDNDETAEVIAKLVGAKTLLLLTSTEGIYLDRDDPSTLVTLITGDSVEAVRAKVTGLMECCWLPAARRKWGGWITSHARGMSFAAIPSRIRWIIARRGKQSS